MKTRNGSALLLLYLFGCSFLEVPFGCRASTNSTTALYSLDPADIKDWSGQERTYYVSRKGVGDRIPEVQPKATDPNGNWGMQTNGFELSLRFRRTEFLKNEPVYAVAILRNVAPVSSTFFKTNAPGYYFGIGFNSKTRNGAVMPYGGLETNRFSPPAPDTEIGSRPIQVQGLTTSQLRENSERMVVVDLSKLFNFGQESEFRIQADFPIYKSTNQPVVCDVTSKEVKIQIVRKLSSAGIQEKKAWEDALADVQHRYDKRASEVEEKRRKASD